MHCPPSDPGVVPCFSRHCRPIRQRYQRRATGTDRDPTRRDDNGRSGSQGAPDSARVRIGSRRGVVAGCSQLGPGVEGSAALLGFTADRRGARR